jgi:hypothetical protein
LNAIDFDALRLLDKDDLRELGLPMGPRVVHAAVASDGDIAFGGFSVSDQVRLADEIDAIEG